MTPPYLVVAEVSNRYIWGVKYYLEALEILGHDS